MSYFTEKAKDDIRCKWKRRSLIGARIHMGINHIPFTWIVSTEYTFDNGWETSVYLGDENGNMLNCVLEYDNDAYDTFEQADAGHDRMVAKWIEKANKDDEYRR